MPNLPATRVAPLLAAVTTLLGALAALLAGIDTVPQAIVASVALLVIGAVCVAWQVGSKSYEKGEAAAVVASIRTNGTYPEHGADVDAEAVAALDPDAALSAEEEAAGAPPA